MLICISGIVKETLFDNPELVKAKGRDVSIRLPILFDCLFRHTYRRVARGLFYQDRAVLALQLAHIRGEVDLGATLGGAELQALLKGPAVDPTAHGILEDQGRTWKDAVNGKLSSEQIRSLQAYSHLNAFSVSPLMFRKY